MRNCAVNFKNRIEIKILVNLYKKFESLQMDFKKCFALVSLGIYLFVLMCMKVLLYFQFGILEGFNYPIAEFLLGLVAWVLFPLYSVWEFGHCSDKLLEKVKV